MIEAVVMVRMKASVLDGPYISMWSPELTDLLLDSTREIGGRFGTWSMEHEGFFDATPRCSDKLYVKS